MNPKNCARIIIVNPFKFIANEFRNIGEKEIIVSDIDKDAGMLYKSDKEKMFGYNTSVICDNNNYVLTAGGSYKQWTTGNTANALVARDGNGYIFGAYFNSAISDENITIGSVYIRNTSDNYIRRISFANFITQVNSADTVSFTKSLKVTQNWMDADIAINTTNFPKGNGAYAVLIDATSLGDGTDLWPSIYSGVMTIYTSSTNATGSDEVILHRGGHTSAKRLYIRTTQNNSGNYKLQIAASNDFSVAKSLVFKFRKLI